MQDFGTYNYNLTIEDLKKAQKDWNGPIVVIINGEYYNLVRESGGGEIKAPAASRRRFPLQTI